MRNTDAIGCGVAEKRAGVVLAHIEREGAGATCKRPKVDAGIASIDHAQSSSRSGEWDCDEDEQRNEETSATTVAPGRSGIHGAADRRQLRRRGLGQVC